MPRPPRKPRARCLPAAANAPPTAPARHPVVQSWQLDEHDVRTAPRKLAQVLAHQPGPRGGKAAHEVGAKFAQFVVVQVVPRDLAEKRRSRDFLPGARLGLLRLLEPAAPQLQRHLVVRPGIGIFERGHGAFGSPPAAGRAGAMQPLEHHQPCRAVGRRQHLDQPAQCAGVLGRDPQRALVAGSHRRGRVEPALGIGPFDHFVRRVALTARGQHPDTFADTRAVRMVLLPVGGVGTAPAVVEILDPFLPVGQQLQRRAHRPFGQGRLLVEGFEPVAQDRVGVLQIADAAHRLAQRLAREVVGRRRAHPLAQGSERTGRLRLVLGARPVPRPEFVGVPAALDRDLGQRCGRHRSAQQPAGDAVGLVFVLSGEREGLGREARKVPAKEGLRDQRHHALVALQAGIELEPRQPRAIDPGAQLAVVAAQVAVFVRQHRQQAPPVQHHQERQADVQRIDRTAEQPETGHLADAGVEFVV